MVHRTLFRALTSSLVCGALAVAFPLFAAPAPEGSTSTDDPVAEPHHGPRVDPNG